MALASYRFTLIEIAPTPNILNRGMAQVKNFVLAYTEQRGADAMTNVLGEKIHRLRKEKGLTLDRLAEMAGASKSYIWELENKDPPRPSAEKVARIAEVLGVTSDFLVDDQEKNPTPDVVDQHFFRQYRRLPDPTKEKLRQMLKILGKDE